MGKQRRILISGKRSLRVLSILAREMTNAALAGSGGLIRIKELPSLPPWLQVLLLLRANSFPFLTKDINFLTTSPWTFHEPTSSHHFPKHLLRIILVPCTPLETPPMILFLTYTRMALCNSVALVFGTLQYLRNISKVFFRLIRRSPARTWPQWCVKCSVWSRSRLHY